jgi:cytochrome c
MRWLLNARTEQMTKLHLAAAASLAALALSNTAFADEKIAQANGCMTCHAIDKKVIGPSYKEVAAKYRGDKDAEPSLFKKVKAGGKGVWGEIPMPPNAHVKDDDIHSIVKWILSLK